MSIGVKIISPKNIYKTYPQVLWTTLLKKYKNAYATRAQVLCLKIRQPFIRAKIFLIKSLTEKNIAIFFFNV
jgi:hypothetical protein